MGGQPWGISTSHALQYNVIFVRCCSSVVTCNYRNAAECAAYKTACYCSNAAMCICCCTWHVPTSASICNHWNKSFFMCCCCYCMCCSFATAACAVAWLCFIVAVAHAGHTRSSLQVLWPLTVGAAFEETSCNGRCTLHEVCILPFSVSCHC